MGNARLLDHRNSGLSLIGSLVFRRSSSGVLFFEFHRSERLKPWFAWVGRCKRYAEFFQRKIRTKRSDRVTVGRARYLYNTLHLTNFTSLRSQSRLILLLHRNEILINIPSNRPPPTKYRLTATSSRLLERNDVEPFSLGFSRSGGFFIIKSLGPSS